MAEERMVDVDRKCPICGKIFGVLDADKWAYKDGKPMKYFCSWTCLRKYQNAHEKPQKPLVIEDEPERRTPKKQKPRVGSREVIDKVLAAIEEGKDPAVLLQKMGYEHWKKWHNLKKWAEKHDPDLRARMPDSLGADRRKKENRQKPEENLVGGTRQVSLVEEYLKGQPDRSEALMKMAEKWDEAHKPPEPGTPVTFPRSRKPQPEIEVIAVRTEMGEFAKHGDAINWIYGQGMAAMHAELTPEEWKDFTREIVPAAMEKLGEEQ